MQAGCFMLPGTMWTVEAFSSVEEAVLRAVDDKTATSTESVKNALGVSNSAIWGI